MSIRRVTVPGGREFDQNVQDAVSRLVRDVSEKTLPVYGIPSQVRYSDSTARFGDLVRVDPTVGAFSVFLPRGTPSDIGSTITIINIGASTNTITIDPLSGTLNGASNVQISKGYFVRQAVLVDVGAWLLTVVLDGDTGVGGGTEPWFEWNGSDLTEFDSQADGSAVTGSTWSTVSSGGRTWIQNSLTNSSGSGFATRASILPITTTPPTDDYYITGDVVYNDSTQDDNAAGFMVRRAASSGIGTGYTYFVELTASGNRDPKLMRYGTSESTTTLHDFGTAGTENNSQQDGITMSFGVEDESVLTVRHVAFNHNETAGTYTAAGKACLFHLVTSVSVTRTVLFSRIKCFTLPRSDI